MSEKGNIWRWERGNDWYYTLSHSNERGWEFSGRGYGTSGYRSPFGALTGWLRFYVEAKRWEAKHRRAEEGA
jgi:hypothetical protein